MEKIQQYMDNVTPQHRLSPRFQSWLRANLTRAAEADQAALEMKERFALGSAQGEQLRTLMQVAGLPSGTDGYRDEDLRRLFKAKIVKNQWDGSLGRIVEIWRTVFGEEFLPQYIDHQDMSATLNLVGERPTDFLKIALVRDAIPKPAGVALTICLRTETTAGISMRAYTAAAFSYLNLGVR